MKACYMEFLFQLVIRPDFFYYLFNECRRLHLSRFQNKNKSGFLYFYFYFSRRLLRNPRNENKIRVRICGGEFSTCTTSKMATSGGESSNFFYIKLEIRSVDKSLCSMKFVKCQESETIGTILAKELEENVGISRISADADVEPDMPVSVLKDFGFVFFLWDPKYISCRGY